jgi:hypothetical protein
LPPALIRSAERTAAKVRARARVERPDLGANCSPEAIAKLLGFRIQLARDLPRGADALLRRANDHRPWPEIHVSTLVHPTRRAFSVGHELMEAHLPAENGPAPIPHELKERWCDRGAAAMMMPAAAFRQSGQACGWDLAVLREWWPFCSWNALVARTADLEPGLAVAAWHQQQLRFRRSNLAVELPEHADALEQFAACEAVYGGKSEVAEGGLVVRAWRSGPGRAVTVVRRA